MRHQPQSQLSMVVTAPLHSLRAAIILRTYLSTVLSLLIVNPVRCQEQQERTYQWEFSAGALGFDSPVERSWLYHAGIGVNFPGRKTGWYTNYALDLTRYGMLSGKYADDYITLTAGKHYQWDRNRFYASLGFNGGIFFAYSLSKKSSDYVHLGIAAHPRGEIGLSFDRFNLAFGMYFSLGAGYFHREGYEDPYPSYKHFPPYWFRFNGSMCPYLKVILK